MHKWFIDFATNLNSEEYSSVESETKSIMYLSLKMTSQSSLRRLSKSGTLFAAVILMKVQE